MVTEMLIRMRQIKSANPKRAGFTLIEVLMAVLLIAILATIAITQFTNFARDTRNATTKENLGILRNAIQKHFGMMRLRCGVTNSAYPTLASLNGNDITSGASAPCNATQIPETTDRFFVSGGVPENPWSDTACTAVNRRFVNASAGSDMTIGTNTTPISTGGNCGWLYNATTGQIKANSNNNTGGSNEGESSY